MATNQTQQPYDCSSYANFRAWAQQIGIALSALGFTLAPDTATPTMMSSTRWSSGTQVPGMNYSAISGQIRASAITARGNWSGGTEYSTGVLTSVSPTLTDGNPCDIVIDTGDGVGQQCYIAWKQTQYAAAPLVSSNNVHRATALTPQINQAGQGLSAGGGTNTGTYTFASTAALATGAGNYWVCTFAGFNNAANNGTVIIGNTTTTTCQVYGGVNFVTETGTAGATMTISGNSVTYRVQPATSAPTVATQLAYQAWIGHSFVFANYTNAANNATFTATAAGIGQGTSGANISLCIGVTSASGVTEGNTSGTTTENTAPHLDLYTSTNLFNNWIPYYYEVWQTNDGNAPMYFRFTYASDSTNRPAINFACSNSLTSNNFPNGSYIQWNNSGTLPEFKLLNGIGTARGSASFEYDIAGNGNTSGDCWFAMGLWRNATDAQATTVLFFDRTRTSNGGQTDTYAFLGFVNSGVFSSVLFKPGAGTVFNIPTGWPSIALRLTSFLYDGMTPALPIFPVAGFVGNPTLASVMFCAGDVTDGMQAMVSVGSLGTHNYLIMKQPTAAGVSSATVQAIRWE